MEIEFSTEGRQDITFWQKSGNKVVLKKIRKLLENIKENLFQGIGKPEPLKFELSGKWS